MCVNGGPTLAERRGGAKWGEGAWKAEGGVPTVLCSHLKTLTIR